MAGWTITDHVCRVCFGRVLHSEKQARCADCGVSGAQVKDVCACGAKLNSGGNAGLRCTKNLDVRPECPAEIVICYVGIAEKPAKADKAKHGGGGLFGEV